ncbi:methyltransferase domain-containing protein [bacterium]|nr:methyltransferase domain-containing protein [bacterium]
MSVTVTMAQHVSGSGMAERSPLIKGSATAMPLPDTCCAIVTAIECGFHLDTREDFLAAAFRLLRPGGRF